MGVTEMKTYSIFKKKMSAFFIKKNDTTDI